MKNKTNRVSCYFKDNAVNIICFFIGFVIMACFLKGKNMVAGSGDAAVTWNYITQRGDYSWPYTLYKGIMAVQPYTLFYKMSLFFNLGEFFFVKLYHCVLFAYAAGIGFPAVASYFLKNKPHWILRILLVGFLFLMFFPTLALDQMMVDLPTMAYFVGAVHCAFAIFEKKSYSVGKFIVFGVLLCICFLSSGQYTIPALFVILYVACKSVPLLVKKIKNHSFNPKLTVKILVLLTAFLVGFIPLKTANDLFEKNVVSKINIPTVGDWMNNSYITRFYTQTFENIPDYRGEAILKDYYGDDYTEELEQSIKAREKYITFLEYMKISLRHPIDSVSRWCNRFFLSFKVDQSIDSTYQNAITLFLSYTLIFVSLLAIKKRCHKWKDVFAPKFWIGIAFIMAIMAGCVSCVELRTCMQLQGLVYTVGILDDTVWLGFRNCFVSVGECFRQKSMKPISCRPVPYGFFMYCIYILMCLIHCASIYEMSYVNNADILFDFKF